MTIANKQQIGSYGWCPERDAIICKEAPPCVYLYVKSAGAMSDYTMELEAARLLIESLEDSIVEAQTGHRPTHPCKTLPRLEK
jgi:hypothetical protein